MATVTPPDWLAMAKDLSAKTGQHEIAVLAVIADRIECNLAASNDEQVRSTLGIELAKVQDEIGRQLGRSR